MGRSDRLRRNKGRSTVGLRAICCLQSVNGDRIMVAILVEYIVLLMNFKGLKRAIIGAL